MWSHPLCSRSRLLALFRYVFFHISSYIYPKRIRYPFIEKTWFLAKAGDAGLAGNVYCGLSDFECMSFLLHYLRKEDLFFDIGSNLGSYTILASGVKKAFSFAFEPDSETFRILNDQIALNSINHLVIAQQKALGQETTTSFLTSGFGTMNYIVKDSSNGNSSKVEIEVVTLDSIIIPNEEFVSVIAKIDVEGYEYDVLLGGKKLLSNPKLKVIMVETNGFVSRYQHSLSDIHSLLETNGFKAHSYDPFSRKLILIENPKESNTIYIRDLDFVTNRIDQSPKFKKFGVSF
jgi:FkbM family methyltransferase